MRRLPLLLALFGLAAAAALVLRFDAGDVWRAMLSVGWRGAAVLLAWQALLALILGLAWSVIQPDIAAPTLVWGRMVRDAATSCLPFSPVGGYVIGARAVMLCGAVWPVAAAGTVVDVSAELSAQLVFALFGLLVLLAVRPGADMALPIALGLALLLALIAAAFSQRHRIGAVGQALAARLLGSSARVADDLDRLRDEMARLYGRPIRLVLGGSLHLTGWFATGLGTWISLRLLGHAPPLVGVLALEALLDAAVAAAFLVPGAAGVQEAGYVGLGAIFGVPPEIALSVSLLRRAREIAWGLPVLAVWQVQELRRL